jgi:hypothetical protein
MNDGTVLSGFPMPHTQPELLTQTNNYGTSLIFTACDIVTAAVTV